MAARVLPGHLPLGIRSSYAFLRARAAAAASSGVAVAPVLPFAGAAATVLAAAYFYTYESEDAVINRMCGVFERGAHLGGTGNLWWTWVRIECPALPSKPNSLRSSLPLWATP